MIMFRRCPERKEGAKEDHTRHGKNLSRITLAYQGMPKSHFSVSSRPKGSHRNTIKGLTQGTTRARKRRGPKCTTHFRCLMKNCSPYWSGTMRFLSSPQDQGDLHIRKDTILMLDVSITKELEGIPQKIARPSRTRSNPWSTQIRSNSENWSVVTKSVKIKDQLGAILVCLSTMNVFIYKCTSWKI